MLKYIFDIFCKDTTIGLCQIEAKKSNLNKIFSNNFENVRKIDFSLKNNYSIGQTVYHL